MEGRQRRLFTDDYKRQAVDLVASSGRSIGSVAKELGLRDSVLRRWAKQRGARLEPTAATRRPTTQATPTSADHGAEISWAQRVLPLKNQLSSAEAQKVETAFAAKLIELGQAPPSSRANKTPNGCESDLDGSSAAAEVVSISKPIRERDRDHLRFVAGQPCLVCGRTPSDAHHLKFAEQRAMGRKVSDKFTVPVCRLHHRELHRRGNERAWWDKQGIDPLPVAASLWAETHAVASVADDEADLDRPSSLNGVPVTNGSALGYQNNEKKTIPSREVG